MVVTAILLFFYDLLSGNPGWSLYTTLGLACAWCYVFLPLLVRSGKFRIFGILLTDYAVTFVTFLLCFEANGFGAIALTFALSILTLALASVLLVLSVSKLAKLSVFGILGMSFLLCAGFVVCLDLLIGRCFFDLIRLNLYSMVTAACLVPVAAFLLVLEKSPKLKESIQKRLFL